MFRFIAIALFAAPFAILCCLASPASTAPIPKHLMKVPEKKQITGVWELRSINVKGMEIVPGAGGGLATTYTFTADTLTVSSGGIEKSYKIKFDAEDGVQRVAVEDEANANNVLPGMSYGYQIEGEKLLLALEAGPKRLAGNPAKPGPDTIILVLTSVPDKK